MYNENAQNENNLDPNAQRVFIYKPSDKITRRIDPNIFLHQHTDDSFIKHS